MLQDSQRRRRRSGGSESNAFSLTHVGVCYISMWMAAFATKARERIIVRVTGVMHVTEGGSNSNRTHCAYTDDSAGVKPGGVGVGHRLPSFVRSFERDAPRNV
jgi:hypothetical protein